MMEQMQGDEMLTRKIELILEMNSKKLMTEVTQLRSELAAVKSMLEEVKRQPRATTVVASQPVQESVPVQTVQSEAATPISQAPVKAEKPIDRNNVAPNSVSIEKIFYYGNK